MIIFYNKITGKITGTIDGRIHQKAHFDVWIGDKNENDRIVCQWKATNKYVNENGKMSINYEPEHEQKDIFIELDKKSVDVYKYKVDINTKKLVLI